MMQKAPPRSLFVFLLCAFSFASLPYLAAQTLSPAPRGNLPSRHMGAVTALLMDGYGNIFSGGEDGFVGLWDGEAIQDRHQISRYAIRSFALRPDRPQIAVIERGGLDRYRVSAWNYHTRENLFTLHFRDPVSYINYSAAGGFLILALGGARAGAIFVHPETGELLEMPAEISGSLALAATGRSERVMISYFSSGILSYWDLQAGEELARFQVPPNIRSPVLFGSSRFLGGFDSSGLLILDAATGDLLARNPSISQGFVFAGNSDSADSRGFVQFYSLSSAGGTYAIYRMEINLDGRLAVLNRRAAPAGAGTITSAIAGEGDAVILGTGQGELVYLGRTGGGRIMAAGSAQRIVSIAASSTAIAFICETGSLAYIPLDFSQLGDGGLLVLQDAGGHARIASDASVPPAPPGAAGFPPPGRF
ncbi:MAG: WD40 repeat domain-containing protein, partial [Treponema sp.]|nr:WD40 repeat domain-containing protein [Treponema sp.]